MNHIKAELEKYHPTNTIVYTTGTHAGYLTYDGIDVNGKRIRDEIVAETERLETTGTSVTKISIIGYSLGGLVCRYAIGLLYHEGYFDNIVPVNFVTFCSPHVGSLKASIGIRDRIYNYCAPYVLAITGSQLFLKDNTYANTAMGKSNVNKLPLLVWMAEPNSYFYKGLQMFKHRALYANTINDRRCSWYTASISALDPFNSMVNENTSAYLFEYMENYAPTVLDISKPINFQKIHHNSLYKSGTTFSRSILKRLRLVKVVLKMIVLAPVLGIFFMCNSVWERIKLHVRVRSYLRDHSSVLSTIKESLPQPPENDQAANEIARDTCHESFFYSFETYLASHFKDQTEVFVDNVFDAVNTERYHDYTYSITTAKGKGTSTPKGITRSIKQMDEDEKQALLDNSIINLEGQTLLDFRVRLTNSQLYIVKHLNDLKWEKYPVIIRKTKLAHAAAIYRLDIPAYDEGKVVVRHFAKEVFKDE